MLIYYPSLQAIEQQSRQLGATACHHCGKTCNLLSHGYIRKKQHGGNPLPVGKRVLCSNRRSHDGCGRTIRLFLDNTIRRLHATADQVNAFVFALVTGMAVAHAYLIATSGSLAGGPLSRRVSKGSPLARNMNQNSSSFVIIFVVPSSGRILTRSISYGCITLAWWLHAVARACISEERRRIDLHFGCKWLHGACSRIKPKSAPPDARLRGPYYAASPVLAGDILIFSYPPCYRAQRPRITKKPKRSMGFFGNRRLRDV